MPRSATDFSGLALAICKPFFLCCEDPKGKTTEFVSDDAKQGIPLVCYCTVGLIVLIQFPRTFEVDPSIQLSSLVSVLICLVGTHVDEDVAAIKAPCGGFFCC